MDSWLCQMEDTLTPASYLGLMILGFLNIQLYANRAKFSWFRERKRSNLLILKCSGLCLNLPLSVQAVRIRQGHCLSHCYFRASTVNTQQVLPRLLRDLTIVGTWRAAEHVNTTCSQFVFPSFPVSFSETYPASAGGVLLSSHLFYCCQWDLGALWKYSTTILWC